VWLSMAPTAPKPRIEDAPSPPSPSPRGMVYEERTRFLVTNSCVTEVAIGTTPTRHPPSSKSITCSGLGLPSGASDSFSSFPEKSTRALPPMRS